MLSRVADSIFWMSRYIERAENFARFIDVNLHLMLDLPPGTEEQWEPLIRATADLPIFQEHYGDITKEKVIEFLTFDPDNPNSILRCLHTARENARSVRDAISTEMWEHINKFFLLVQSAAFRGLMTGAPHAFYSRIKMESHLFNGIAGATMSHGEGWHFARMGRQLERADKTARLLDVKYFMLLPAVTDVGTPLDNLQWSALLKSASALEMFRKRHGRILPDRVADFLILDPQFPRSIRYCLAAAESSLRAVSGSAAGTFQNPAEQLLGRLCAQLNYARIDEIIALGLHEFVNELQCDLNGIDEAIFETFFAPRPVGSADAASPAQAGQAQRALLLSPIGTT
jgi:uncharacterized alpha-E superfamily protein